MARIAGSRWKRRLWAALLLASVCLPAAAEEAAGFGNPSAEPDGGRVVLDETVISGNQELPKVLYILPWQQPKGLPEIELRAHFAEEAVFRRLYPPAYRREMTYFEKLKDDYYALRGWDQESGYIKKETLDALDLAELIAPLGGKAV